MAAGSDVSEMRTYLPRVPGSCRQLRAQIERAIAQYSRTTTSTATTTTTATPNSGSSARCRDPERYWRDYTNRDSRWAIREFLFRTPAECSRVRQLANKRLEALPLPATIPADSSNPADWVIGRWEQNAQSRSCQGGFFHTFIRTANGLRAATAEWRWPDGDNDSVTYDAASGRWQLVGYGAYFTRDGEKLVVHTVRPDGSSWPCEMTRR